MRRAAIYARVSTANGQTCENQILALQSVAERHGWEVAEIFEDTAISGAKGRDQRPALDRMMRAVKRLASLTPDRRPILTPQGGCPGSA